MRKQYVIGWLTALALVALVGSTLALPPFDKEWKGKYVEGNKNEGFVKAAGEAKCNVCHDPATKSKKDHNVYGKVVKKYLTKNDYNKIKGDKEAALKYILDGLDKAAAEKDGNGKTYGDKIKAGELPSS
jgi:hypothetical protein